MVNLLKVKQEKTVEIFCGKKGFCWQSNAVGIESDGGGV